MGKAYFRQEEKRENSLKVGISPVLKHGKGSLNIFRNGISARGKEGGVREEGKEKRNSTAL